MREITLSYRLEVLGAGTIIIPGCEPESTVTSTIMSRYRRCTSAYITLEDALAAIPGSYIEFQTNNGLNAGTRKKWFVLPAWVQDCPGECVPDYYQMLRDAAHTDEPEPSYAECEVLDQGFCKKEDVPAIPAVYKQEGDFFGFQPSFLSTSAMMEPRFDVGEIG